MSRYGKWNMGNGMQWKCHPEWPATSWSKRYFTLGVKRWNFVSHWKRHVSARWQPVETRKRWRWRRFSLWVASQQRTSFFWDQRRSEVRRGSNRCAKNLSWVAPAVAGCRWLPSRVSQNSFDNFPNRFGSVSAASGCCRLPATVEARSHFP